MYEFQPYFTNDGSVGLYNSDFDDIYHSASGALTEAYEKFIYPIDFDILLQNDDIKILDICYGIGYNTKGFLNYIFKNQKKLLKQKKTLDFFSNKSFHTDNIETIYTNNISQSLSHNYNETIHTNNISNNPSIITCNETIDTDNIFNNISVTCIDNDEILVGLSPFIKTGKRNFVNKCDIIEKHNIKNYLTKKNKHFPKIENFINYEILSQIYKKSPEIYNNSELLAILSNPLYKDFISGEIRDLFKYFLTNNPSYGKLSNLHNIYYRYITNCYKMVLKTYKIRNFDISVKINDARQIVKNENSLYNLIFLDAFTHSKCPCLWSYEFFKELHRILHPDGMLFTYSSAAIIRSAMIESGFIVGKIYNQRLNKFQGTIAVKNEALIKYPLTQDDFGLLKTRAGIFYRDKDLTGQNEAIITQHEFEVKNSKRISTSQYIKKERTCSMM